MNSQFINSFLSSVVNVIGTMTSLDVKPGKPCVKKAPGCIGAVTGRMNMSSPQASGILVMSFTAPVVFEIVKQLLDEELLEINDTATDMVGEITNMVTGAAKNLLVESGFDFDMSSPLVFTDDGGDQDWNGNFISVPIDVGSGQITMDVCFTKH